MTKEAKEKSKFRSTAKWKSFRKWLKSDRKVDALTGSPLTKGFQAHHCDMTPGNYDKLIPENFETLNPFSHKVIHFLFRTKDWRKTLENAEVILKKMEKLNKN